MKIALDAMGGDFAPKNEILGAIAAVKNDSEVEVVLVGDETILNEELKKLGSPKRITVVDAKERILMSELPTQAIKKEGSSLMVAINLLKENKVDALVSAGNTGAVLAASIFKIGRIKNVDRPAIVAILPTMKRPIVVLDLGANVDCKTRHLVQFAKMGSVYSQHRFGIDKPEVRLFNIGEEEYKGNELTTETYQLLKQDKTINFVGNLEPSHLLAGNTDVVVCDGFVGNVVLKLGEGLISTIFKMIKGTISKSLMAMFGAIFMLPALKKIKKKFDYDEFGGTLLLGVKKPVIKAHGSASPKALKNAIREAAIMVREQIVDDIAMILSEDIETPVEKETNAKK
jgi:glycerol-3-phosphate acyltransferase PlsX